MGTAFTHVPAAAFGLYGFMTTVTKMELKLELKLNCAN